MADSHPVAIVTGGTQGLGAAICIELINIGYNVCVADIQEEKGKIFVEDLQKRYGSTHAIFSACDVTKETDFRNTFDETLKAFLKIDLLVNNAGVNFCEAKQILQVNTLGTLNGCQTAMDYMSKSNGGNGGMVINIASAVGLKPCPEAPVYAATKHFVVGLTRSFGSSFHYSEHGISFTALCPSIIETEMAARTKELFINGPKRWKAIMSPEYAAKGVLKLLKDNINGSTLLLTQKICIYVEYPEELKQMRNLA